MALKRQQDMLATFSMASMTDVVFLLLVFFMVTSAFVFPTALDIDLPQSSQQTAVKPSTRVFIDAEGAYYVATPASVLTEPSSLKSENFFQKSPRSRKASMPPILAWPSFLADMEKPSQ